jgi:hypothetical protein
MGFPERILSVSTTLRHLIYISYRLPASRVRPFVPRVLPLDTLDAEDGEGVFLSLVLLRSTSVRPAWLPWSPIAYNQLNLRTYVRHPGSSERAVYFFTSAITSRLMLIGPRMFGLPWKHLSMAFTVEEEAGRSRYAVTGIFRDPFRIEIEEDLPGTAGSESSADAAQGARHITTPSLGFISSGAGVQLFHVVHPFVPPRPGRLMSCDFPYLTTTGLLTEGEAGSPHNILVVDKVDFSIRMPPTLLT